MRIHFSVAALGLSALAALVACSFTLNEKVVYRCATDADCGGDGYSCPDGPVAELRRCCKPTGAEVCDQLDNDCDGIVDNTGVAEVCNGQDDDCDGTTDEGFDFQRDVKHCGRCNNACQSTEYCNGGRCELRSERVCYDGLDDDGNGLVDCDDPTCDRRQCGAACTCRNLHKAEDVCSDGLDNEQDGLTDCFDTDCLNESCGVGCSCAAGGVKLEVDCADGEDNDGDALADCLDVDCVDKFCTRPKIYYQCTTAQQCKCNGGVQISEVGSVLCRDGVDNDCDGEVDCDEASCIGVSCAPDGGAGQCECALGFKKELDCGNAVDDDGDGKIDCEDSDCAVDAGCP